MNAKKLREKLRLIIDFSYFGWEGRSTRVRFMYFLKRTQDLRHCPQCPQDWRVLSPPKRNGRIRNPKLPAFPSKNLLGQSSFGKGWHLHLFLPITLTISTGEPLSPHPCPVPIRGATLWRHAAIVHPQNVQAALAIQRIIRVLLSSVSDSVPTPGRRALPHFRVSPRERGVEGTIGVVSECCRTLDFCTFSEPVDFRRRS